MLKDTHTIGGRPGSAKSGIDRPPFPQSDGGPALRRQFCVAEDSLTGLEDRVKWIRGQIWLLSSDSSPDSIGHFTIDEGGGSTAHYHRYDFLLPRCYQDRTTQPHLAPGWEHPALWFLVGLDCLRLDSRNFVNRRSRVRFFLLQGMPLKSGPCDQRTSTNASLRKWWARKVQFHRLRSNS